MTLTTNGQPISGECAPKAPIERCLEEQGHIIEAIKTLTNKVYQTADYLLGACPVSAGVCPDALEGVTGALHNIAVGNQCISSAIDDLRNQVDRLLSI